MQKMTLATALASLMLLAACNNSNPVKAVTDSLSAAVADTSTADAASTSATDTTEVAPKTSTISLAFVGDVMMGTNFPTESTVMKDRGRSLFDECKDLLTEADLAIANLEGTCYDGTEGEIRKQVNSKTCFIFRMPGDHAQNLVDAGVDVVNFANNHSFDFGNTGRRKTLEKLEEVGLKATGIKDLAEGCVVDRNGVRIGYVSFAASCTKVLDLNNPAEVERAVKKYRPQCDILVVGFHGGGEGTNYMHIPKKKEYFLGECRGDVWAFAHKCIDLGADIVVGHGPHIPRAMELYKGHLIAYSLGNFCGPYRLGGKGMTGHSPLLVANVSTDGGAFVDGQIHSFLMMHGRGPKRDSAQAALKDIKRLTAEDFPETPLSFGDDGKISIKRN